MTRHSRYLVLLPLCLILVGARADTLAVENELFLRPETRLGQAVEVRGFLFFGFENRNLFMTPNWRDNWGKKKACIPIGVKTSDRELLDKANSLNGTYVVIRGTMVQLVGDGEVNESFCKDVGILVQKILSTR